ncbi:MAG: beta-N-acetylhexosaminidase [Granulosicoccus sp.]
MTDHAAGFGMHEGRQDIDPLLLESYWIPDTESNGRIRYILVNNSGTTIREFKLCLTSTLRFEATVTAVGCRIGTVDGSYQEFHPESLIGLCHKEAWAFELTQLLFKPAHANDGALSAFVLCQTGEIVPVVVAPLHHAEDGKILSELSTQTSASSSLPGVIPWPNTVLLKAGSGRIPDSLIPIDSANIRLIKQACIAGETHQLLFPDDSPIIRHEGSGIRMSQLPKEMKPEGYELHFDDQSVIIMAGDDAGVFYALISLLQLVRAARLSGERFQWPAPGSRIKDRPGFSWRGAHLDVARRFYPDSEVRFFLAIMSWYKLNCFHWHLTDDEGWRIEIGAYPELTEIGSFRGLGKAISPQLGDSAAGSHGFYSKSAVSNIVRFAAERHIEIMPEIDMPGHATAALRSLPWLVDPGESRNSYLSIQGFYNNALNPAVAETSVFVNKVVDEIVEQFPGPVVHIGGDEVPQSAWHESPLAIEKTSGSGLTRTTQLQNGFTRQVQQRLALQGKITGLWDDGVVDGLAADNVLVFVWRDARLVSGLLQRGFDIVMTPAQACYLDIARTSDWIEPGASWVPAYDETSAYRFDVREGLSVDDSKLLGMQSCLWSEYVATKEVLNRLLFPRLLAIAESAWTETDNKSLAGFNARIQAVEGVRLHPEFI